MRQIVLFRKTPIENKIKKTWPLEGMERRKRSQEGGQMLVGVRNATPANTLQSSGEQAFL